MRGVRLLAITVAAVFAFALPAVAQATNYGLKIDKGGEEVAREAGAEAIFQVTSPAGASKCKWREPVGEVEKTKEPVLEIGFNEEHITPEECEGAGQKHGGFTRVTVSSFFGTLVLSSSEKGARVRLAPGSKCVYAIGTMVVDGGLTLPSAFKASFTAAGAELYSGAGCAATHEFTVEGTITPEESISKKPYELVES